LQKLGGLSYKMLRAFVKQPVFKDKFQNRLLEIITPEVNKMLDKIEVDYPKWKGSRYVNVNKSNKSIRFGFANSEAEAVENGTEAQQVTETYTQFVKAHKRRTGGSRRLRDSTTEVRKHKRTYRGYKSIQLPNGEFRMVSVIRARKGKKILEKLVKNDLSGDKISKVIVDTFNGTTFKG